MSLFMRKQLPKIIPRLQRFAYGLTGNLDDAEELLQEACMRAIGSEDSWQPDSRLDSWMYRIVKNIWLDTHRHSQVVRRNAVDLQEYLSLQPNEQKRLEHRSTLFGVRKAMDKLPEEQRLVLVLVCLEKMTYLQTSEILDIPVGTVMSRLARARKSLVNMIDDGDLGAKETIVPEEAAL